LETGFTAFDRLTGGLLPGTMTVVSGRPSVGKTALALNIIATVAIKADQPKPVGVFTLEMGAEHLTERLLHLLAGLDLRKARSGHVTRADQAALRAAASSLGDSEIHIDEKTPLAVQELQERARRMRATQRIELLVIDYFQLIRPSSSDATQSKQLDDCSVAAGLQALAKELEIPLLVLAHLNRPRLENRLDPPRLSDMRDSTALASHARTVAILARKEEPSSADDDEGESRRRVELIIAKHEAGLTGSVPLLLHRGCGRFETAPDPL
jgi:replicative DNA helicase